MLQEIAPQIWRFEPPQNPQRHIAIVAGIHGDETAPVEALEELSLDTHPIWRGCSHQVTLIIAHPEAVTAQQRTTLKGADFNRSFGATGPTDPLEARRITLIKEQLADADIVLDLHQTRLPIAPCAVCPPTPAHLALAEQIGAVQAVTGAQLQFLGGMLIDWANRQGSLAITLETGQIGDPASKKVAHQAILSILKGPTVARATLPVWELVDPLLSPGPDYQWTNEWHNGSPITVGQVIADSPAGVICATVDGALFLPRLGQPSGAVCGLQAVAAPQMTSTNSHIPPT